MSERSNKVYLEDIAKAAHAILSYIVDIDFNQFCNDRKTISATIRELEIIGEAVGKISIRLKEKYKTIEWRDIKDMRNILIHEYFGIDHEIIWKVIKKDIPGLLNVVTEMLIKEFP